MGFDPLIFSTISTPILHFFFFYLNMILDLSQRFHEIHSETFHLSSIQSSLFTSWQNIQLRYRSSTGHGRGGYDSTSRTGIDRDSEPCSRNRLSMFSSEQNMAKSHHFMWLPKLYPLLRHLVIRLYHIHPHMSPSLQPWVAKQDCRWSLLRSSQSCSSFGRLCSSTDPLHSSYILDLCWISQVLPWPVASLVFPLNLHSDSASTFA